MFTELRRCRLTLYTNSRDGTRQRFALRELVPDMSRDARRVLAPAEAGFIGETNVELLVGGLGHLGRLVCQLDPRAKSVELRLARAQLTGAALPEVHPVHLCNRLE
jgi:hypothetical protein